MAYVLDYAGWRPDPHSLTPYVGAVCRYLTPDLPSYAWKRITPDEYRSLIGAGLDVLLNWELSQTRALQGLGAGQADGSQAAALAHSLGHPALKPVYFSVDTMATFDQVQAYFQGVQQTMGGRPVGVYGGTLVTQPLRAAHLVQYVWISNAASWSGAGSWSSINRTGAHLIQHLDHPVVIPGANLSDYDVNEVLDPLFNGAIDMPLDPANQWDKVVIEGVQEIVNALTNPGAAPHSLLQDIDALEVAIQNHLNQLQPGASVDPVALAQAIAAHVGLKAQ